ncbi:unnamed protein product [Lathyrus sativus]|nr:unnamed protein product [Lathyrus sativus]
MMMKRPYSIRNMSMLLSEWKPDFNLKEDMLRTLPIWIKLLQCITLMGAKSLRKIGSTLGTSLLTDECTANKLQVSYARILVEVDVTQDLKKDIIIKDNEGRKLVQIVKYEWKLDFVRVPKGWS